MRLAFTTEQEEFRQQARSYLEGVMTPELRARQGAHDLDPETYRRVVRQVGDDGWLCVSWPQEYGGRGLTEMEEFILFDEAQRAGVPIPFLTTNTVGPTLMAFGTQEQKQRFLPAIVRGEVLFSIGYSEPEAGTDLASLRTTAVRDGDDYVITGQKMWTSLVDRADYVWLACRTDPDAPKHKGISILVVPTSSDGFSWTKVDTLGGGMTSATYYDEVRVPASNLVGAEHGGWRLMTAQLNQERVALASSGLLDRRLEDVRRWAQSSKLPDGTRVVDQPAVQANLARVRAKVEVLRLLNWKVAWGVVAGDLGAAEASAMKVYGSELFIEAYRLLMEVLGPKATLRRGSPGAVLEAELESAARAAVILTFGGGTNEVQREIIATLGLGLTRAPR